MELAQVINTVGDVNMLVVGGVAIGFLFGAFAQRSRFCLRSATIEFRRREPGTKLAVWLLVFSVALTGTQAAIFAGWLDVSQTRQLATTGSMSGAAIGGLMFGVGMICARGCASRLLVLSANGNLRALLSGLIFAVTAQAAYRGALAPLRAEISSWWLIEGGPDRSLLTWMGLDGRAGIAFGLIWLVAGLALATHRRVGLNIWIGSIGAGVAIVAGWLYTYAVSQASFDIVPVESLTFSGPSADLLMLTVAPHEGAFDFGIGIMPGVFLGSFTAALLAGELKLEGFQGGHSMRRYIIGAILMGFGAMLAGGCAVGAGISGGSILALTAWTALVGMWGGAMLTDWVFAQVDEDTGKVSAPLNA
ncbi:YeeE/YedE family protein [Oricola cellulosilytica]|uniref:YeeE/YedE family protein n=1 Tax=Oricola cellulosilytica TaxID=1429082 RepID=A0A4R0PBT4_9HYPH|nr:YeeE/YedE family protein [Oricola cellulosilytica]TCD13397.1 YeeE/YedE family protein [Oricola cellulosilytica]